MSSASPPGEQAPSAAIERLRALIPHRVHPHAPIRNLNELHDEQLTLGARVADRFAIAMGSWPFIIIQSIILVLWIAANIIGWMRHWDPYPFILLNLALSFQSAYAAPILMMSQNREAEKDRLAAQHDYDVNVRAEAEIHALMNHLEAQHEMILAVLQRIEAQEAWMTDMMACLREEIEHPPPRSP